MRLLIDFLAGPFVKAARRDDAAPPLEGVAEHRLAGYGFRAGVERRRHFFWRFLPPAGNEAPAHRHQLALAVLIEADHIDGSGRRDIVVRLQIARRPEHAEEGTAAETACFRSKICRKVHENS